MAPASLLRRGTFNPPAMDETISLVSMEESDAENRESDLSVPKYTIDLSLKPEVRYNHVALDFKSQASKLPAIFDELVRDCLPTISVNKIKRLARLMLRRVYNCEENKELRGISHAIGMEMWLLVAFNVLLDLFMGCTSGGVRVEHDGSKSRMLHFRTLDWGMDPLRKMIVHLDFVESAQGEVIASSLGYFGYVGVLTGVRKGLSVSLNFRPNHNRNDRLGNFIYYSHIVLVLLGFRPSISSLLRQGLLPSHHTSKTSSFLARSLESIRLNLPHTATTAAYLIFSDGDRTLILEKDNDTASVRSADDFITVTNHDAAEESGSHARTAAPQDSKTLQKTGMEEVVEESVSRKNTIVELWKESLGKRGRSRRLPKARQVLNVERLAEWMDTYPITNEETHFAAIMDPKAGKVVWVRRYIERGDCEEDM